MKIISLILLVSCGFAGADAPRKQSINKYQQLWKKSLVTVPPPPPIEEPEEVISELDDYVLGAWTKTSQGYLVSLINIKEPSKRKTIAPGMPNSEGFQVLEVKRDPLDYTASQVLIKLGVNQKWIGYEEKYLVLQQPRQAKQPTNKPKTTNTRQPQQPSSNQRKPSTQQRKPRVSRVPVPPKK